MVLLVSENKNLIKKLSIFFSSKGVYLKHIRSLQYDIEITTNDKPYFIIDLSTIKDFTKLAELKFGTILLLTPENIEKIEESDGTILENIFFEFFLPYKRIKEEIVKLNENVIFHRKNQCISNNGEIYPLTTIEHKLLSLFIDNRGEILTIDEIINSVWGIGYPIGTDSLYVYINRIRKKIEKNQKKPKLLITKKGVGYGLLLFEISSLKEA